MKARDIALEAAELVSGDRADQHGDLVANHQAIAAVWNGYLLARIVSEKSHTLNAEDVANMMELLKVARRLNGHPNADDYRDGAGYAAIAGQLRLRNIKQEND